MKTLRLLTAILISLAAMAWILFPIYWQFGALVFSWPGIGILAWGAAPLTILTATALYRYGLWRTA